MPTLSSWMWILRSTMWWVRWTPAPQTPRSQCSLAELQVNPGKQFRFPSSHIHLYHPIISLIIWHALPPFPISQIFSSQRASPPGSPTWAAWGTWPSITAEWASTKPFWSVGRSALEPVPQRNPTFLPSTPSPSPSPIQHWPNTWQDALHVQHNR